MKRNKEDLQQLMINSGISEKDILKVLPFVIYSYNLGILDAQQAIEELKNEMYDEK